MIGLMPLLLPVTRHSSLVTVFIAVFMLFDISVAFAKGEIHPRLNVREEYNDNVFLEPDGGRGDFITTVQPGVSALWDAKALRLDLDYGLRFRIYERFDEKSETSPRDTQRALARAELFPGRDFTVTVADEYSRVIIDPRRPVAEENDFVNRTNRNRLEIAPRYRFVRRTWSATVGYAYENLTYNAVEGDDSEAHRGTVDLEKALSSRLSVLASVTGEARRFEDRTDYRRADGSAGLTWRPSGRLTLTARGGSTRIDYKESAGRLPGEDGDRILNWQAQVFWQIRPTLTATASYGQSVLLSVKDGLYQSRTAEATLACKGKIAADLRFRTLEADYLAIDRRDRLAGAGLTLGIPFGKALALVLRADVERLNFQPGGEDAWRYRGTSALTWTGRRMTATAGYDVNVKNSDVDASDYVNNIVYLQGGVKF